METPNREIIDNGAGGDGPSIPEPKATEVYTSKTLVEHQEGTGENRHLSGAQRRKIERQKAIEEGRPIPRFGQLRKQRKREEMRNTNAARPENSANMTGLAGKRAASKSLEKTNPVKKPRATGSYAAAASNHPRIILTCGDYLGREMPADICKKLKEEVVSQVIAVDQGDFVPKFAESFPRKGSMVFVCLDKDTAAWLEGIVGKLDLGVPDLKVRVVNPNEVKITKVMTWLPEGVKSASDLLKLVQKQNGGVDTSRWAILKEEANKPLVLGLNEPSVETLRNRKLTLLAGVGKVTFKVLDRSKAGGEEAKVQEEAERMMES